METRKITTQELVKEVAAKAKVSQVKTREFIDALNEVIVEDLKSADKDTSVEIKLFSGVSLMTEFVDAHEARNPKTGELVLTEPKLKVKAKFTPTFKKGLM